jgi:hypothetical protein
VKMGDRKTKRLDAMGVKSINKPRLTMDPKNRAERRTLERMIRKAEKSVSVTPADGRYPNDQHD